MKVLLGYHRVLVFMLKIGAETELSYITIKQCVRIERFIPKCFQIAMYEKVVRSVILFLIICNFTCTFPTQNNLRKYSN